MGMGKIRGMRHSSLAKMKPSQGIRLSRMHGMFRRLVGACL
jgi:hypothetical protein